MRTLYSESEVMRKLDRRPQAVAYWRKLHGDTLPLPTSAYEVHGRVYRYYSEYDLAQWRHWLSRFTQGEL